MSEADEKIQSNGEDALIALFQKRSSRLRAEGYCFLATVLVLLLFGGYGVFNAPVLTSNDISTTLDNRQKANDQELARTIKENNEVWALAVSQSIKLCLPELRKFMKSLSVTPGNKSEQSTVSDGFSIPFRDNIPSGSEMADAIEKDVQERTLRNVQMLQVQLTLKRCGDQNVNLTIPMSQYLDVIKSVRGFDFKKFDRKALNELWQKHFSLEKKIGFLEAVQRQIYAHKVDAQATGAHVSADTISSRDETIIVRLAQTSITRFGILGVIGFLVSLLVSLYRYNVRLAAFYLARADLLRIRTQELSVSDFSLLAAALTPQLEFGKAPRSPAGELIGALGILKGLEKSQ